MQHLHALLPLSLLMGLAACAANPGAVGPVPAAPQSAPQPVGIETVQRTVHPSGPTVRREWRKDADAPVTRIQIANARSRHLLVGQARLQRLADGGWQVTPSEGTAVPLDTRPEAVAVAFFEAGQRWWLRVQQVRVPTVRPGIATEGEHALDLWMEVR
jgi:hypothetical protein